MKKKWFTFLFFFTYILCSQEKFSKEINFITENDLYTSVVNDRYYTNGMFLSYRYLSKNVNDRLEKKIFEWTLGQEMFTPYKSILTNVENHDRSFAAYLFLGFGVHKIYKSNQFYKSTFQIGFIGPNAFGKELQDFIHNIYGFKEAIGWSHQIKNALAVNYNFEYAKFISKSSKKTIDLTWINSGKIGTVYANITTGFYSRIGFKPLQKLANSIAFKTHLNNKNTTSFREIESFLFISPTFQYTIYDATLQGSFLNKGSEVTSKLFPFIFNLKMGFQFTAKRISFGYIFNYNTKKAEGLKFDNGHNYGTINISYLIK